MSDINSIYTFYTKLKNKKEEAIILLDKQYEELYEVYKELYKKYKELCTEYNRKKVFINLLEYHNMKSILPTLEKILLTKKTEAFILIHKQNKEIWDTYINLTSTRKLVKDLLFSKWKKLLKSEEINEEESFRKNGGKMEDIDELMFFMSETFKIIMNGRKIFNSSFEKCIILILHEMVMNYNPEELYLEIESVADKPKVERDEDLIPAYVV